MRSEKRFLHLERRLSCYPCGIVVVHSTISPQHMVRKKEAESGGDSEGGVQGGDGTRREGRGGEGQSGGGVGGEWGGLAGEREGGGEALSLE